MMILFCIELLRISCRIGASYRVSYHENQVYPKEKDNGEFRVFLLSAIEYAFMSQHNQGEIRSPKRIERLNSSVILYPKEIPKPKPKEEEVKIVEIVEEKKELSQEKSWDGLICSKHHPLIFDSESKIIKCETCLKQSESKRGSWKCNICKTTICLSCIEKILNGYHQKKEPSPVSKCPNGHKLTRVSPNLSEKGEYKCNVCVIKLIAEIGSWKCIPCNFQVCPLCYNGEDLPEEIKEPLLYCRKNHQLKFSTNTEGYGLLKAICDQCHKRFDINKGRMNCSICKYDLCKECVSGINEQRKNSVIFLKNSIKPKAPKDDILKFIVENYIEFLSLEDFIVLLCVQKKFNQNVLIPFIGSNIKPLIKMIIKNGQTQFRKWFKKMFLNKNEAYITQDELTKIVCALSITKNQIKNPSGKKGFENWILDQKNIYWTIEDEWVHLPDYRKEHFAFCGSATPSKISQSIPVESIFSLLKQCEYNCVLVAGAYVARRWDYPCEATISFELYDSANTMIFQKTKKVGAELPERGIRGEKVAYRYVVLSAENQEIIIRTKRIIVSFLTKTAKKGDGWNGARFTDIFLRSNSY